MDFGLAKLVDARPTPARSPTPTSTSPSARPGYICPEQVRGEEMDHRGDLYSVGVILFELLTGRLPFSGRSTMDVLLAHATEEPPKFVRRRRRRLGAAGHRGRGAGCLAKAPADRPASARDLAERYETALLEQERPLGP